MGYGMGGQIGISFQETTSVLFQDSMDFFPFISESIGESIDPKMAEGMTGRFDEGDHYEGLHDVGGDLSLEIHPILFGKLLKAWHGHESATLQGSCYLHAFVPVDSDYSAVSALPPMTIEAYRDVGTAFYYYDMTLDSLSVEIAPGEIFKSTASFKGGRADFKAAQAASYEQGSYFTWDQSSVQLEGVAVDQIGGINVTFGHAIEPKAVLDGTKFQNRQKRSGYRSIEVAGTLFFDTQDEFFNWRNQAMQTLRITATGQTLSGSQSANLDIDIPKFVFTEYPVAMGGPGEIEVSFSGRAKYHAGSGTLSLVTMVNTKGAY